MKTIPQHELKMRMNMKKDRYITYSYWNKLSLVQDPFNTWLSGKILVQDQTNCSVVAWFADKELAENFCELLNEREREKNKISGHFSMPPNCGDSYAK
jgi:hypothetical protein